MARFFVSYSHSDGEILNELVPHLREAFGADCLWFDVHLTGGVDWWKSIQNEIRQCEVFIYLLSDASIASSYCRDELEEAIGQRKKVLPVVISVMSNQYPFSFRGGLREFLEKTQYIDMSNGINSGTVLSKLYSSISKLLSTENVYLTRKERWILLNQYTLLSLIDPDNKKSYEKVREILESGYELHYSWIAQYIYGDDSVMTPRECLEILDILDMYSQIQRTYRELKNKSGIEAFRIKFMGFDGNSETKYMSYVRFLIEKENKYNYIDYKKGKFDTLSSGSPMLQNYRFMLQEYKSSSDPLNLTKEDLIRIFRRRT